MIGYVGSLSVNTNLYIGMYNDSYTFPLIIYLYMYMYLYRELEPWYFKHYVNCYILEPAISHTHLYIFEKNILTV